MKNLLAAICVLLLSAISASAAQKTIHVGSVGDRKSLNTNFGNAQDNFTELYGKRVASGALTGSNLVLTLADSSTVTIDVASLLDNTDAQSISGVSLNATTHVLTIGISGGSSATVDLSGLIGAGGLADASSDGSTYGRKDGAWVTVLPSGGTAANSSQLEGHAASYFQTALTPGTSYLRPTTDVDDTPVNGETAQPVSSNWAYDHAAATDPHTGYMLESNAGVAATNYLTLPADPAAHTLFGFDNTTNTYKNFTIGSGLTYTQATNTLSATGGGTGDVVGPASTADNTIPRYDSTTGKLLQSSTATLSDAGVLDTGGADAAHYVEFTNSGACSTFTATPTAGRLGYSTADAAYCVANGANWTALKLLTNSSTATITGKTYSTTGTGNDFTMPLNGLLDFAITDPVDADDLIIKKVQNALTLTDIYCLAEGGGTITVTYQECTTAGASCANIEGAITADSDGAEDDGTLTDGAIAAGAWIKILFSAPSGTVNNVACTVYGTQTL